MKLPLYYLKVVNVKHPNWIDLWCVVLDPNDSDKMTSLGNFNYKNKEEALAAARDLMKIFEPGLVGLKEE